MRLIDQANVNRGVVTIQQARDIAAEANMDLVEVAPNASPPVVRVMNYGKFSYEKTRKERDARKHQKQIEIKTIQLRPKTGSFHREISVRKAREWLMEGKKVKVLFRFQAREISYPEIGQRMMETIATELQDIATIEQKPNMEGWSMTMLLNPIEVKK